MKWQIIEIHMDGVIHRANFRVVGETLEVSSRLGESRHPKGSMRAEIAAREVLRKMIRRGSQAA